MHKIEKIHKRIDESNNTVVMNYNDYDKKIEAFLFRQTRTKELYNDLTISFQNERHLIKLLFEIKSITNTESRKLNNAVATKINELP